MFLSQARAETGSVTLLVIFFPVFLLTLHLGIARYQLGLSHQKAQNYSVDQEWKTRADRLVDCLDAMGAANKRLDELHKALDVIDALSILTPALQAKKKLIETLITGLHQKQLYEKTWCGLSRARGIAQIDRQFWAGFFQKYHSTRRPHRPHLHYQMEHPDLMKAHEMVLSYRTIHGQSQGAIRICGQQCSQNSWRFGG